MTAATPGPVNSTDAIRLALRSWPEVESYLQGCKGVIIPLGSTAVSYTHLTLPTKA